MVDNVATTGWVGDMAPIAASDWSYDCARHLLDRAGFGGTPDQIDRLYRLGPVAAVSSIVDFDASAMSDLPEFSHSPIYDPTLRNLSRDPTRRHAARRQNRQRDGRQRQGRRAATTAAGCRPLLLLAARQHVGDDAFGELVGGVHAALQAAPAGEDGAVLARAFRDRRRQSTRLPQDAGPARTAADATEPAISERCWLGWRRIRRCWYSSMPVAT